MPWTKTDYPVSMKNLPPVVRNKAIEIGNALLEKGRRMDEGILIATAISRARDWAANRGLKTESTGRRPKKTDVKSHGEDRYVTPHRDKGWAVKEEGEKRAEQVFRKKSEAIRKAIREAKKARASVTIQKRTGRVERKISYNPNRRKN